MTAPASGAQVTGSITLSATATDNIAVAGVTFRGGRRRRGRGRRHGTLRRHLEHRHHVERIARAHGGRNGDPRQSLGTSPGITVQVVQDTTAPLVVALTPAANATAVSGTTAVSARFNEALDSSRVSATTFALRNAATGTLATAVVSYDAATNTAILSHSVPLAGGVSFTATITGGLTGVRDVAGNALAANVVWSFTVRNPPLPGLGSCGGLWIRRGNRDRYGGRVRPRKHRDLRRRRVEARKVRQFAGIRWPQ